MKKIEFVIFDMDGLLFDTERMGFNSLKKSMEYYNYSITMNIYKRLIGAGYKEDERILKDIYGGDFDFKSVSKLSQQIFEDILKTKSIQVMPGVRELLDDLDSRNIKKCIASSSSLDKISRYLKITNLHHRFDFYLSGDEVEKGKPHPDIFIEACRRGNVKTSKALIIEDSLNGLRAAKGASIKCVIIPDLIDVNNEIKKNAFHVTGNLANLVNLIGSV